MLFHVPSGGYRNKREAARLKRQGVKSGLPDIFLDVPTKWYKGLRIELKIKPNEPTQNQIEYIEAYIQLGFKAMICYSADEAIEIISKYLGINNKRR